MKIKRSMVVLFVVVAFFCFAPGVAFAATVSPDVVDATEQMIFSPLVYLTAALAVVMLSSVVVSVVLFAKYKAQKELVCSNYVCASNPKMLQERDGLFDYSQFETPAELSGVYTKQREFVMEETIQRLTSAPRSTELGRELASTQESLPAQGAPQTVHVAQHKRVISPDDTAPIPHIKLVPEMKHARRRSAVIPQQQPRPQAHQQLANSAFDLPPVVVPEELEYLVRKIG